MKSPKLISEKDQGSISEMIEKFMPDDEKPLEASEIIKHLGDSLSEDAGENPIIEHLSKNAEKSFTRDDMKVMAGKFGVEKYKEHFELSEKEPNKENDKVKNQEVDDDLAERMDRFMNGGSSQSRPKTVKERVNALTPENRVIFKNIKEQWMKSNKDKDAFKHLSEEELNEIADKIVIEALEASLNANIKAKKEHKEQKMPTHQQPTSPDGMMMSPDGMATGLVPIRGRGTGNALIGIAKQTLRFAVDATSAIVYGASGLANNLSEKAKTYSGREAGLTISPEGGAEPEISSPNVANTSTSYEDKVVDSSKNNLKDAITDLDSKMSEISDLRKEGTWAKPDTMTSTSEKLKALDKNIDEISDLKSVLGSDIKRKGVNEENKLEGIKALDEAKRSIKNARDGLSNSPNELAVKEKMEKVMKAIDRLVKSIKNLFSKKNENTERKADEPENSLSM